MMTERGVVVLDILGNKEGGGLDISCTFKCKTKIRLKNRMSILVNVRSVSSKVT